MRTESKTVAFHGQVARATAEAMRLADPAKDSTGTFKCTRCGSALRFTVLMGGKASWGRCSQAGCVKWQT